MRRVLIWSYLAFLAASAFTCYHRPVPEQFDRYMYEAIVRQGDESWEEVFTDLRQSYPRFRESSVADSAEHMALIEPFYGIKSFYLVFVEFCHKYLGFSPEHAISFVSAASLFAIGMVLLPWVRQPLLCAAVIATPAVVRLGRLGTPDALSTAFVFGGCYALVRGRTLLALLLLLSSIYIRTDNVIPVLVLLAWGALVEKRFSLLQGLSLAVLAMASVGFINEMSGNYGWAILFRHSFLTFSNVPTQVSPHVSPGEYIGVLKGASVEMVARLAPWLILAIAAWQRTSFGNRWLLAAMAAGVLLHFVLFPATEDRFYAWSYLVTAAIFAESLQLRSYGTKDGPGSSVLLEEIPDEKSVA